MRISFHQVEDTIVKAMLVAFSSQSCVTQNHQTACFLLFCHNGQNTVIIVGSKANTIVQSEPAAINVTTQPEDNDPSIENSDKANNTIDKLKVSDVVEYYHSTLNIPGRNKPREAFVLGTNPHSNQPLILDSAMDSTLLSCDDKILRKAIYNEEVGTSIPSGNKIFWQLKQYRMELACESLTKSVQATCISSARAL